MSNQLLQAISTDLQVFRYNNEDSIQYEGRLLYSAVAAWCRNMMNDKSYSDFTNTERKIGIDLEHIAIRLSQVIDGMFEAFPYGRMYFQKTGAKELTSFDIASKIVKDMSFSYECSKTLDSRRLCQTPQRNIEFAKSSVLALGGTDYKSRGKYYFVGCGKWLLHPTNDKNDDCYEFWGIPHNEDNYLSLLTKYAEWRNAEVDNTYLKLDITKDRLTTSGFGWYSFSKRSSVYPLEIIQKDGRYFLLRHNDDEDQIAELNQWYIEEKELYRIILAIKKQYYKPLKINVKNNGNHVIVSIGVILPNPETRILLLSSWGYNDSFDRFSRIVPIGIWDDIKPLFENLGFEIINS